MTAIARVTTRPAALLASAMLLVACSESGPRVYTAQRYDTAGCLEPYSAVGLVQSRELDSSCAPSCVRLDGELYVSSVCAPYPARSSLEPATTLECSAALAALARGATCEPRDAAVTDGSVTDPSRASLAEVEAAPAP
jgi:hypothetical protein